MGKYQINGHSVLTVKKDEAQDGKTWHSVGQDRAHKQHPHGINEGDSHHIKRFDSGLHLPVPNAEETKTEIDSLEERIKQMQAEKAHEVSPQPQQPQKNQYDEDVYDEWFKEE